MMTIEVFMTMLFAVSVATGLVTQAVKTCLDGLKMAYSSNMLAGVVSVVVGGFTCYGHILYSGTELNQLSIAVYVVFVVMSWICAMVGYDKVVQAFKQIAGK
ncbi:MAG: aminopeptidase [Ruminococcus sp.]|nr:aminopeptidase [Ruminococcus sp.]